MKYLDIQNGSYSTSERKISPIFAILPTIAFYAGFIFVVFRAGYNAKRKNYPDELWGLDSFRVLSLLEKAGVRLHFKGFENLDKVDGPCVFVGNHMSIMETVILPSMILPFKRNTFVVKDSLLTYPIFKHVMRSRNPVAVTRTNPRQDLKTVMTEGVDRLSKGISIIVFPQTTRATGFDPESFGSIGVKLARKAGVPIIPMALKTDAWENGTWSKDLGRIYPEKPVCIEFGEPIEVVGKGAEEHQRVIAFISEKLQNWQ